MLTAMAGRLRWGGLMMGAFLLALAGGGGCAAHKPEAAIAETHATADTGPKVILVTLDGMRWQEMFGGFDPLYATKEAGGVGSKATLERITKAFARESAEESRAAIMPFFWGVVAQQGQVFGDRGVKNVGRVTNPYKFSYPGYNELLCGYPDPRINSNEFPPNPNVTVLEWLNGRPGFAGKVAAYGAWTRIHEIVNEKRAGFPIVAGWRQIPSFAGVPLSEREQVLNALLARTTQLWPDEPPDSFIQEAAIEYLIRHKPRVFYVSLGETDEWAHMRRYDLYLESALRSDAFIKRLWETVQSMPEYAGRTSLVITTDHGRGATPKDWTDHGAKTPGAEGWWAAVLGPQVPAKGVIGEGEETQGQIAATVAALVGEDYRAAVPKAAAGLPVVGSGR
jgi:hypothetical protein